MNDCFIAVLLYVPAASWAVRGRVCFIVLLLGCFY